MAEFLGTFPLASAITPRMRLSDEVSDADLMRRAAAGDRDAFAAVYRRHSGTVYRFARLMTGCAAAAEDIVQEAFLSLLRDAARYDPERASLSTYLYGVARHQTRRRRQRDRRFVQFGGDGADHDLGTTSGDPAGDLVRQDEMGQLRRAIVALPSRYREALILCDLQDVSYADAAAAMDCAVGTVRSRLHRARQLLTVKMRRAESRVKESTMRCTV
jgi:RNA polymerase sigma-70 factor (ECF subfamily)